MARGDHPAATLPSRPYRPLYNSPSPLTGHHSYIDYTDMAKVTLIVVALFLVVAAAWCAPAEPQPAAAQDKEELQPAEKDDLKPAASHWGGHHGGWGGHYGGWGGHYGGYYPYYGSYWSWPYSYYWPHGGYGGYGGYGHHGYWW